MAKSPAKKKARKAPAQAPESSTESGDEPAAPPPAKTKKLDAKKTAAAKSRDPKFNNRRGGGGKFSRGLVSSTPLVESSNLESSNDSTDEEDEDFDETNEPEAPEAENEEVDDSEPSSVAPNEAPKVAPQAEEPAKRTTMSQKAGLTFPTLKVLRSLKEGQYADRIQKSE